jgi:hypothetical protein
MFDDNTLYTPATVAAINSALAAKLYKDYQWQPGPAGSTVAIRAASEALYGAGSCSGRLLNAACA